jgi:hypothetical protein
MTGWPSCAAGRAPGRALRPPLLRMQTHPYCSRWRLSPMRFVMPRPWTCMRVVAVFIGFACADRRLERRHIMQLVPLAASAAAMQRRPPAAAAAALVHSPQRKGVLLWSGCASRWRGGRWGWHRQGSVARMMPRLSCSGTRCGAPQAVIVMQHSCRQITHAVVVLLSAGSLASIEDAAGLQPPREGQAAPHKSPSQCQLLAPTLLNTALHVMPQAG